VSGGFEQDTTADFSEGTAGVDPEATDPDTGSGGIENTEGTDTSASEQEIAPPEPASGISNGADSDSAIEPPEDLPQAGNAETTSPGNSYTAEITSERVLDTDQDNTSFTFKFTEVGDKVIGSAQVKMPDLYGSDGFKDFSFDPSTGITTSSGKNWTGALVDIGGLDYLNLWALSASDYLNPGESVSATFTATTPTETGIYKFETEAWINAAAGYNGVGSTVNNMAAGYEDPTVGIFEINSPVLISSVAELEVLSTLTNVDDLDRDYVLVNNINFADSYDESDWSDWNSGAGFKPIGSISSPFTGSFNGGIYTISNLYINRPTTDYIGLFGYTSSSATLQNIALTDVDITGKDYVGGLVGWNDFGKISDSYTTGPVNGTNTVGGLVGKNYKGTIEICYTTGKVTGTGYYVGGLVGDSFGDSDDGMISYSYATGNVGGTNYIGGLVGYNTGTTIENSYATGNVGGTNYIGGLVGENSNVNGMISDSYATGTITGSNYIGGLVGENYGEIEKSSATGTVTGVNHVGGLLGRNYQGEITYCHSSNLVNGTKYVGGLVGYSFSGKISNNYTSSDVKGNEEVGGLVGYIWSDTIENCYSVGSVEGAENVGGLVGLSIQATIKYCYATGDVKGNQSTNYIGGLIGNNSGDSTFNNCYWNREINYALNGVGAGSSGGAEGKTTAEMKTLATYASWDITGQDGSYPVLGWQVGWASNIWYMGTPPAPFNTNGGNFGGDFGLFDFGFPEGAALLDRNGFGLTTITGQSNAPISPGIIASGGWNDLYQASAAYQAALARLENDGDTLSPAELALLEAELAIAKAALLAMEARLLAADGLPYNLAALQAAYAAAVATLSAQQGFLSADQQAAANQLLTAIAGIIAALQYGVA